MSDTQTAAIEASAMMRIAHNNATANRFTPEQLRVYWELIAMQAGREELRYEIKASHEAPNPPSSGVQSGRG